MAIPIVMRVVYKGGMVFQFERNWMVNCVAWPSISNCIARPSISNCIARSLIINSQEAISYIDQIRTQFIDQPDIYVKFLHLLQDFRKGAWVFWPMLPTSLFSQFHTNIVGTESTSLVSSAVYQNYLLNIRTLYKELIHSCLRDTKLNTALTMIQIPSAPLTVLSQITH